jgi:hypothetical protein
VTSERVDTATGPALTLARQALCADQNRSVHIRAIDNCNTSPNPHGQVANPNVDVIEFAP